MSLSVIIPTLNEAAMLTRVLGLVSQQADLPVEVIVADCGSTDATRSMAARVGVRVVGGGSIKSRSRACNAGAEVAGGEVLLFLHADSVLPKHYDRLIRDCLRQPGTVGGAFEFKLDGPQWRLRLVECINRMRYRRGRRFFGDQGIFVLSAAFKRIGGFPNVDILEDVHFCDRARRLGTLRLITAPMLTSPRRFYNGGILRTLILDGLIMFWDLMGLNPNVFAAMYRRDNIRRGIP